MAKRSAGVLLYRRDKNGSQVLLAHPGGPFWSRKDEGSWSIPKGEYDADREDALTAARRELHEETGILISGKLVELGTFEQPSGKLISAWAAEADFDPSNLKSNTCRIEWPPRSGRMLEIPEVDRVDWFSVGEAMRKIVRGQLPIIQSLVSKIEEKSMRARCHGDASRL